MREGGRAAKRCSPPPPPPQPRYIYKGVRIVLTPATPDPLGRENWRKLNPFHGLFNVIYKEVLSFDPVSRDHIAMWPLVYSVYFANYWPLYFLLFCYFLFFSFLRARKHVVFRSFFFSFNRGITNFPNFEYPGSEFFFLRHFCPWLKISIYWRNKPQPHSCVCVCVLLDNICIALVVFVYKVKQNNKSIKILPKMPRMGFEPTPCEWRAHRLVHSATAWIGPMHRLFFIVIMSC